MNLSTILIGLFKTRRFIFTYSKLFYVLIYYRQALAALHNAHFAHKIVAVARD